MVRALRTILTENRWWHLPRYAAGASRGGAFALILALHFPLQARARLRARRGASPARPRVTCLDSRAQGAGSMVMGMKPLELLDGPLAPRDAHTNATWAYPPVLLMQAANDQPDVVSIIDRTIPVFAAQVRRLLAAPPRRRIRSHHLLWLWHMLCVLRALGRSGRRALRAAAVRARLSARRVGHPCAQAGHAALPLHARVLCGARTRRERGGVGAPVRALARGRPAGRARLQRRQQRAGARVRRPDAPRCRQPRLCRQPSLRMPVGRRRGRPRARAMRCRRSAQAAGLSAWLTVRRDADPEPNWASAPRVRQGRAGGHVRGAGAAGHPRPGGIPRRAGRARAAARVHRAAVGGRGRCARPAAPRRAARQSGPQA